MSDDTLAAQATPTAADIKTGETLVATASDAQKTATPAEVTNVQSKEGQTAKTETVSEERVVPEKYDLKPPENSKLTADDIERIASNAREQGLTNDEAQALVEIKAETMAEYAESQKQEIQKIQDGWLNAAKTDKEVGGDKLKESSELARRVVERFGTADLKKALVETRFGDHPEVLRFFARIGKAMAPDTLVMSSSQSSQPKSMEAVFYPNDVTQE